MSGVGVYRHSAAGPIEPHRERFPPTAVPWKWLLAGLLIVTCPASGVAQIPEDPPQILSQDAALSEPQRDHAEAVALYTQGRALLQRGSQLDGDQRLPLLRQSLRCMQRAWWFDHELVPIMEDIFPLAYTLNHDAEATRYAILAAEQQTVPTELLQRVAMVLAEQDEFDRALSLYRKMATLSNGPPNALAQFEIGRLSLLVGQPEEAAAALAIARDALEQRGDARLTDEDRASLLRSPEVTYALLGEGFARAKRWDEAEAMFRRADESKPNPAMLGLRLALIEKERGHREQALQQLDRYFSTKTTAAGMLPYQRLAELLEGAAVPADTPGNPATGQPSAELLDRLRALATHDPHNVFLGYFLADRLRAASIWEDAEAQYRKMLELEPAADGHQGLVDIFIHRQQHVPLLEQLGQVVGQTGSLSPLEASIDPLLKDSALLEQLASEALAKIADPTDRPAPGVLMALTLLEAKARNLERAEQFWNEALKQPGPSAGHFAVNYGLQLFEQDQAARAAAVFQHVLDEKLLPDRPAELYYYMTGAWTLAKDYDKALTAAREAAKLEPHSARMAAREAWVLYQAQRLAEAEQAYLALLERFDADHADENREAVRDIRFVLSAMDVEQNHLADAEEWLQQVLDEFPEDIGALNDLGYLWCDQGKHLQRALAMLQRAVQAQPDNIAYRDSLGWALYRVGRYAEALTELQIAAAAEKADGVILDHVGDAYEQLKQLPAAVESWQKAAAAFERQEDTKRLQQVQDKIKQHAPQ